MSHTLIEYTERSLELFGACSMSYELLVPHQAILDNLNILRGGGNPSFSSAANNQGLKQKDLALILGKGFYIFY